MAIERVPLGTAGIEHVMGVLQYQNALCRSLLRQIANLPNPLAFTFVQPGVVVDESHLDWSIGGAAKYLPSYLEHTMQQLNGKGVLLFDDVMASPGDAFLPPDVLVAGGDVCHQMTGAPLAEDIETTLWATAVSWHFVCVVCDGTNAPERLDSEGSLDLISQNWREIVVGAFDGEGFIHLAR